LPNQTLVGFTDQERFNEVEPLTGEILILAIEIAVSTTMPWRHP
jgi:hypothetical protein